MSAIDDDVFAQVKQLLDRRVLVPVSVPSHAKTAACIPADTEIGIIALVRLDGSSVIPMFTSAEHVFRWSPGGEQCAVMTLRELFESSPGMDFHLNPESADGLLFSAATVATLLTGAR